MSRPAQLPPATATGIGSWPGTDQAEAIAVVRGELEQLPHLPELPARGPGGDLVGRTAARLVDLPVDLQPSGWRLVDRPGRDLARAEAFWREDLDRLAHAFDGWQGPLKVQLAGPWTLAATLELARGERALTDPGAVRDLLQSSAEAVRRLVADLERLVPGAAVVVQLDEPSLPAVLDGRLPTASGYGRVRPVPPADVRDGLAAVLTAASDAGAATAVHCCAADVPVALLRDSGADAISLDVGLLGPAGWESVAAAVEAGTAPVGRRRACPRRPALDPAARRPRGPRLAPGGSGAERPGRRRGDADLRPGGCHAAGRPRGDRPGGGGRARARRARGGLTLAPRSGCRCHPAQ